LTRFVYGLDQALDLLIGQRESAVARHAEAGMEALYYGVSLAMLSDVRVPRDQVEHYRK